MRGMKNVTVQPMPHTLLAVPAWAELLQKSYKNSHFEQFVIAS
jgi:hypothetical protein